MFKLGWVRLKVSFLSASWPGVGSSISSDLWLVDRPVTLPSSAFNLSVKEQVVILNFKSKWNRKIILNLKKLVALGILWWISSILWIIYFFSTLQNIKGLKGHKSLFCINFNKILKLFFFFVLYRGIKHDPSAMIFNIVTQVMTEVLTFIFHSCLWYTSFSVSSLPVTIWMIQSEKAI